MSFAIQEHDAVIPTPMNARISVRAARVGLVVVLVAALVLGAVSLRYGSNVDPSDEASATVQTNR